MKLDPVCRVMPFLGANEGLVVGLVSSGKRPVIPLSPFSPRAPGKGSSAEDSVVSDGVPAPVARLIEACWVQEPHERPSFEWVLVMLQAAAAELNVSLSD